MNKNKEKKERQKLIKDVFYAIKTLWQACPAFVLSGIATMTAYWFFTAYIQEVLFLKKLLEIVTGEGDFKDFIMLLLVFCVAGVFAKFIDCLGDYFSSVGGKTIYKNLNEKILKKAAEVDVACYENPEFFDNYKRATEILTDSLYYELGYYISVVFSGTISGIFLVAYVASIDAKLLLILLSVVAVLGIDAVKNKINYKKDKEMTIHKRQKAYVQRVVFLRDYAKDARTSNIFAVMKKRFTEAVDNNREIIAKYGKKLAFFELLTGILVEAFPVVATYSYAAYRFVVKKNLKVADFSVLMTAISNIKDVLSDLGEAVNNIQKYSLYFGNLRTFLNFESTVKSGNKELTEIESVEFKNVSFTYPGAEKPSLNNVNLKIETKQTVAVVGKNGAGKSTFVKLLLHFYDPTEGEIFVNGINIKEYDILSLRQKIGTVFQDYKVFALSVDENVLCREVKSDCDLAKSEKALRLSGVYEKIETLPQKSATVLTREFDDKGAGLSGGEAQKVAAARMFAHDFSMAVLDEPSSALDPIAEYKMYESLIEATENKTVVYISHRLSSAVLSDKIYVFDGGTVAEEGSHEELMSKGGIYAEMFTMQASSYNDSQGGADIEN